MPNSYAIVGCGGITNYLYDWLVRYLISKNEPCNLYLIDGDEIEVSNMSRQWFESMIGSNKAEAAKSAIESRLSTTTLLIHAVPVFLNTRTVETHRAVWLKEGVIVLACVDNNSTRVFLESEVEKLKDAVLICGGNEETSGQAQIFWRRKNRNRTPKISDIAPEILQNSGALPGDGGCLVSSGGQTAMANWGTALAMAIMLQRVEENPEEKPKENEIALDLARARMTAFRRPSLRRKKKCRTSSEKSPSAESRTTTSGNTPKSRSSSKRAKSSRSRSSATGSRTS
jgi:molybdopterin/thiamine biosynthesis adenylyltransferase